MPAVRWRGASLGVYRIPEQPSSRRLIGDRLTQPSRDADRRLFQKYSRV